jgi:hypothetical protein
MLPITSIPTEVICRSLRPYQGFVLPVTYEVPPSQRGYLSSVYETVTRLSGDPVAELALDPTPIFQVFVDLFGYDLAALRAGDGECGVADHGWNTFGRGDRIPLFIRWRAFGGEAILALGGDNPFEIYLAALSDRALAPHVLKVLKILDSLPQARPGQTTEELAGGKVAVLTRTKTRLTPWERTVLSTTVELYDQGCDGAADPLIEQLADLRYSANWRRRPAEVSQPGIINLSWHQRLTAHSQVPRGVRPDLDLDLQADDRLPASLLDHLRHSSFSDVRRVFESILQREFITYDERVQRYLLEEGFHHMNTSTDPEQAERAEVLEHYVNLPIRKFIQRHGSHAPEVQLRACFSRDFRTTPPERLVGTGPALELASGEVTHGHDLLRRLIEATYERTYSLLADSSSREQLKLSGRVIVNDAVASQTGAGGYELKGFDLDRPYFAMHGGLPVLVDKTLIGWKPGMTQALACDYHVNVPHQSLLYAALRQVPIPKEWGDAPQ